MAQYPSRILGLSGLFQIEMAYSTISGYVSIANKYPFHHPSYVSYCLFWLISFACIIDRDSDSCKEWCLFNCVIARYKYQFIFVHFSFNLPIKKEPPAG